MSHLRRIVMVRHGETEGNSSVRYHGSGDVPLSDEGRQQLRAAAQRLRGEAFDLVLASPLRRSWEGARLVAGATPVRLEPDFREVDFGRWEGMTAEEIQASDPVLYQEWQEGVQGFAYPGGESRAAFVERVRNGLEKLAHSGAANVLFIGHKGVIRTIGQELLGAPFAGDLELGGVTSVSRAADGSWFEGRHGSDPPGIDVVEAVAGGS